MLPAATCLMLALLTGCASTGRYQSPEFRVPDSSQVELTQSLRFPGRAARIYIQFGEILRWSAVDQWAPYCSFGLNRKRDGRPLAREVGPAVFDVTSTRIWVDVSRGPDGQMPGGLAADRKIMVASLFGRGGHRRDGTPSLYIYNTTLVLYSDREPQVDDLTCAYRGERMDRNLTLDEIRHTLGGIARIR